MTHRSTARLIAVLLPAALLAPGVAHAERTVIRDPDRDVVRIDLEASEEADTEVTLPAAGDTSTDITRVVVEHGEELLTITVDVWNLRHHFFDNADIRLRSQQRLWGIQVVRSGRETYTSLTRGRRGTERMCGGLVTRVDTSSDAVVVTVPTTCIEDPRWVRVGVALVAAVAPPGSQDYEALVPHWDEAGVRGFEDDELDVRGPKVHRG